MEIGEERKLILQRHVHVDVDFVAVGERAHHMRGATLGALEPANILAVPAAFENAEPRRQRGIPSEVHLALLHALDVGRHWKNKKRDVFLRNGEVVDHADVGNLDPAFPSDVAFRVGGENVDVVGGEALGFVAVGDHLAGGVIELGMSSVRKAMQTAAERVVVVHGFERERIHRHGRAIFLQREEQAMVIDDVRVGGAAADALTLGSSVKGLRYMPNNRLRRGRLGLEPLRARIAALEIDVAVLDAEHADVAFAVEGDVALHRGILPVGSDAIEGAVDIQRDLAVDVAVVNVALGAEWSGATESRRIREWTVSAFAGVAPRDKPPATALVPAAASVPMKLRRSIPALLAVLFGCFDLRAMFPPWWGSMSQASPCLQVWMAGSPRAKETIVASFRRPKLGAAAPASSKAGCGDKAEH